MSNTKSITAIQSTPQAIMYTVAVMTGTNWMTGTLSLGRSLGIDIASTTGMNKDHLQRLFRQLLFFCRLPSVDIHNRSKEH